MALVKGICYDGFPPPYNPSQANKTCIFFGTDAAYDAMTPLWGERYTSSTGTSCGTGGAACRNDLDTMRLMGVELLRLYDREPRNKHMNFLNNVYVRNMHVLAPVSCYFLGGGFNDRETQIPALIRSFANPAGTDYHSAIAGIIFGNELEGYSIENMATFTKDWARIENEKFPSFRKLRLGHPLAFIPTDGAKYPCFGYWNRLVPLLADIRNRLFLAPQTYNDATYLFTNAEGSNQGWVDLAWNTYKLPILFTEIGKSRLDATTPGYVTGQLQGVKSYCAKFPERLLGACFFQFLDKVWVQGTSEGSFGAFSHTNNGACTIRYTAKDFTHWDVNCDGDTLLVEQISPTFLYGAVKSVYTS